MLLAIKEYIEQYFDEKLSDELYNTIKEKCYDFNEIYDNCVANEFFFACGAMKFLGIGDMKLTDIVEKER